MANTNLENSEISQEGISSPTALEQAVDFYAQMGIHVTPEQIILFTGEQLGAINADLTEHWNESPFTNHIPTISTNR